MILCRSALMPLYIYVPDLSDLLIPASQTNKPFEFNPSEHTLKMMILKQPSESIKTFQLGLGQKSHRLATR